MYQKIMTRRKNRKNRKKLKPHFFRKTNEFRRRTSFLLQQQRQVCKYHCGGTREEREEREEEREQSRRVRGVFEEISEWKRDHCGDYFGGDTLLDVQY
jgi:hypothetical protein